MLHGKLMNPRKYSTSPLTWYRSDTVQILYSALVPTHKKILYLGRAKKEQSNHLGENC